ncbi:mandelate racemase/muconate lactonizing enzyme family protein [Billgrantia endophytica]|uniref:Mandelate racemase n=1 Tax=Billgrantia endophytica TaxID=2033802 RepID=A0A2N7U0T0_9GAMM|nr:mandelate racemase/muconate lactonizing enzyme family protein [Halomonas endophytica]PMR74031.1 mandelate racemase [Halomonas endophytica]
MKINRITEKDLPISSPGSNAVVNFKGLTTSVVMIESDIVRNGKALVGYGFGSIGRWGVGGLLRERFIPRLMAAPADTLLDDAGLIDPFRCWEVAMANEKPGGHGERAVALGALDMALWDLLAKAEDVPLWRLLANRFRNGVADERVEVYAAGGYYEESHSLQVLKDEMQRYCDLGYTSAKIKIGGAVLSEDMKRIEAAISVLGSPSALAVDANGRFDLKTALSYAEAIEPLKLRWYEEAGDPLDYRLQATLAEHTSTPLAGGENIFSSQDAKNLLRYAGMRPDRDILQFDCGLSYGLPDYLKTLSLMAEHGWSWRSVHPHGGHQMSLNLAAGLGLGGNESYPGVFQPLGGFADHIVIENGSVRLHDTPGIGFELKPKLWDWLRSL